MEQALQGRHGIYDMKVSNQRGELVAMFRGKSTQIQGTVIPDPEAHMKQLSSWSPSRKPASTSCAPCSSSA